MRPRGSSAVVPLVQEVALMERCSAPLPASAELQGRSAAVPHRAELRIPSWCRMMQDVLCWLGLLGAQPGAGCSPIPALLARASWSFASWLIGRAQSKMVLFLRTLCRCFQRWFLPAARCFSHDPLCKSGKQDVSWHGMLLQLELARPCHGPTGVPQPTRGTVPSPLRCSAL